MICNNTPASNLLIGCRQVNLLTSSGPPPNATTLPSRRPRLSLPDCLLLDLNALSNRAHRPIVTSVVWLKNQHECSATSGVHQGILPTQATWRQKARLAQSPLEVMEAQRRQADDAEWLRRHIWRPRETQLCGRGLQTLVHNSESKQFGNT